MELKLNSLNSNFQPLTNITYQSLFNLLLNGILLFAAVLAFVFLLWGGTQWIMAGGDKEGTDKARKRITNALIGLAVVFSAYAIVALINAVFGINILSLTIPKAYQ